MVRPLLHVAREGRGESQVVEHCRTLQAENLTIVSPDAGGAERARAYAKRLDAELAIIDKRRSEDGSAEVMKTTPAMAV